MISHPRRVVASRKTAVTKIENIAAEFLGEQEGHALPHQIKKSDQKSVF